MHKPVLTKEVIEYLAPKRNENFIDVTFGGGGHAQEILKKNGPKGKLLGIDLDPEIIRKNRFQERIILVNDSYVNLKKIVKKYNFSSVNGILFDLGMSSWHLEGAGRGFSFLRDEPLDMRYGDSDLTAQEIVNEYPQKEIEKILREYGEEKFSKRIAQKIVEERKKKPIRTTFQLNEVIKKAIPVRSQIGRIHFGTRTFQALRIAVNDELNNLRKVLSQTVKVLSPQGRIVIISFHSLEDRIVKNFFKDNKGLKILTKKPIRASAQEIKDNPRARSAKLRAAKI